MGASDGGGEAFIASSMVVDVPAEGSAKLRSC